MPRLTPRVRSIFFDLIDTEPALRRQPEGWRRRRGHAPAREVS